MRLALPFLAISSVCAVATPGVAAAQTPRIFVREVSARTSNPALIKMRTAVTEAVSAWSVELVRDKRLPERLVRCELSTCIGSVGRETGATHVLNLDAKREDEEFKISFELWEVQSGKLVAVDGRECLICDDVEFVETAGGRTRSLLARAFAPGASPGPSAGPTPDASAISSGAGRVPSSSQRPADGVLVAPRVERRDSAPEAPAWRPLPLWAGVTLAAGGITSAVYGFYLLSIDGDNVCGRGEVVSCDSRYYTKTPGALFAIGGAVATLGGVGLALLVARPTSGTTVALSPYGFLLGGRF